MPSKENTGKIELIQQESGKVFVRLGAVSFFAFLFFHIDFLAIASSILLGAFWASSILAKQAISGVHLKVSARQPRTHCEESMRAKLVLINKNRFLPIFYPVISVREAKSLRIQVFQHQGIVPPRKSVSLDIDPCLHSRGLQKLEAFAPRSRFPFSLHQAIANRNAYSEEVIVWPIPVSIDFASLFQHPPRLVMTDTGEKQLATDSIEAVRVRDYNAGDPKTRINWKLSAKLDKLTVIDPRDEVRERYELHLSSSQELWPSSLVFERMLRLVTAVVQEFQLRKIIRSFTIDGKTYPLGTKRQTAQLFDALALLEASKENASYPSRSRRNSLWILPAPYSQIKLSALQDINTREEAMS